MLNMFWECVIGKNIEKVHIETNNAFFGDFMWDMKVETKQKKYKIPISRLF